MDSFFGYNIGGPFHCYTSQLTMIPKPSWRKPLLLKTTCILQSTVHGTAVSMYTNFNQPRKH